MSINAKNTPFYCDYGTSVVAIRCGSDHAVVEEFRLDESGKFLAEKMCELLNTEAEKIAECGMKVPLVKVIENLVADDKPKAIAYAEQLVRNTERNYNLFGGLTHYYDRMTARNVLHVLKGEPKEGGVAVCD